MPLKVVDREHFEKVQDVAQRLGLLALLEEKLDYLHRMGRAGCEVRLGWDFAPLSFFWAAHDPGKDKPYMVGGLIFHSCVRDWSVHT